jgi:hypothetical protein
LAEYYGSFANSSDIVGCALDIEARTIQYWLNGIDLCMTFSNVIGSVVPYVALTRRSKLLLNFGKDNFAFPQPNYNMVH